MGGKPLISAGFFHHASYLHAVHPGGNAGAGQRLRGKYHFAGAVGLAVGADGGVGIGQIAGHHVEAVAFSRQAGIGHIESGEQRHGECAA